MKGDMTKEKFQAFEYSRLTNEHSNKRNLIQNPIHIHEDRSNYLHFIKDGIYHSEYQKYFTFCSGNEIVKSSQQYDIIHHYLIKSLRLNFFDITSPNSDTTIYFIPRHIKNINHSLEECEENNNEYYQIFVKGIHTPLYLKLSTKLYDDNCHQKRLFDIIHGISKRKILGLNYQHQLKTFEIDKVKNITKYEERFNSSNIPFYEYEFYGDQEYKNQILINQILVDLD
jgi:hypothetical protein